MNAKWHRGMFGCWQLQYFPGLISCQQGNGRLVIVVPKLRKIRMKQEGQACRLDMNRLRG